MSDRTPGGSGTTDPQDNGGWPKYNPERHAYLRAPYCPFTRGGCGQPCSLESPCRCCETARADAAEARAEDIREVCGTLSADLKVTRLALQACQEGNDINMGVTDFWQELIARRAENEQLRARADDTEATIARVREELGPEPRYNPYPYSGSFDDGWNVCRERVIDALDGPDD